MTRCEPAASLCFSNSQPRAGSSVPYHVAIRAAASSLRRFTIVPCPSDVIDETGSAGT
jgi:hypothetical protein